MTFLFSSDMTTSSPALVIFFFPLRAVLRRDDGGGEDVVVDLRGPPSAAGPGVLSAPPGDSALPSMSDASNSFGLH